LELSTPAARPSGILVELLRRHVEGRHSRHAHPTVEGAADVGLQHLGDAHGPGAVQLVELVEPQLVVEPVEQADDVAGCAVSRLHLQRHQAQLGEDVVVQPVCPAAALRPADAGGQLAAVGVDAREDVADAPGGEQRDDPP
jgi:hypothetical protein